jgi:hypothetical protein
MLSVLPNGALTKRCLDAKHIPLRSQAMRLRKSRLHRRGSAGGSRWRNHTPGGETWVTCNPPDAELGNRAR